ncbi:DNA starvation/stationary phase protection protein Dps [Dermatobacter hominis]|uniref:DNA starvation/stationary phase protection protein Dps n=1 Tax=Dermatobacter hominis TaxID=2884263 RepID=UPI001D12F367|nr:DNA starvation/stationary phase protection protein Dps [Dermatobacter hominis]UDY37552.1 DNA starvation/stationary phase protection protein Dps [Dermatobacter hominis]
MPTTKKRTTTSSRTRRAARPTTKSKRPGSSVPELSDDASNQTVAILQNRLVALLDLQLTLKHVHWNVTGPNFIAIHEMLDPQVLAVRAMSDALAERIATCGGTPLGTPGAIVEGRTWDDYSIGRATTDEHLQELDRVYQGVIGDHRTAIDELEDLDPVSEDLVTGQAGELELFGWFVRSHLGR